MDDQRALFVRIPAAQAAKLDLAARELGTPKQRLIAGLVERYVDPSTPQGLDALARMGRPARVLVETGPEAMAVGHHSFRPSEAPDVLSLEQAAALLQVGPEAVRELAEAGELPGRRIGEEWRFARRSILEWLAGAPDEGR